MFQSIGFIGAGNMGSAVAQAAAKSGLVPTILLANRTRAKAEALAQTLPGGQAASNGDVAQLCDLIFLAVKPQMMAGMLAELKPVFAARKNRFVLATMAAGLSCALIQELAGGKYPVIRMMPNTPVSIGAGVIQYCGAGAAEAELADFAALLAPAGVVDELPEYLIDAACSLSGCGPAFVYLFLEGLADGAVACGLPRDKALRYAAQTAAGAAGLLLQSGKHPGALKDAVCSPGGSTIEGVRTLESRGFRGAAMDAVISAFEKNKALGKS